MHRVTAYPFKFIFTFVNVALVQTVAITFGLVAVRADATVGVPAGAALLINRLVTVPVLDLFTVTSNPPGETGQCI